MNNDEIPNFKKSNVNYTSLLIIVPTLIGMLIGGIFPTLIGFGVGLSLWYVHKNT